MTNVQRFAVGIFGAALTAAARPVQYDALVFVVITVALFVIYEPLLTAANRSNRQTHGDAAGASS